MNNIQLQHSISQMNNLYVTWRRDFLEQYMKQGAKKASYTTQKYTLTDYHIKQHLLEKKTIGVKLGSQGFTKFMAFDVDYEGNLPKAKAVTEEIVKFLRGYYGIDLNDIHVHFSGNKGYHVSLFFNETLQDTHLKNFYNEVLNKLELRKDEVEFRASSQYGVKLPLGIHQTTKNYMNYMVYEPKSEMIYPLTKDESIEYFLNIEPMSTVDFRELILNELDDVVEPKIAIHTQKDAVEFEGLMSEINLEGKSVEEQQADSMEILRLGRLKYPDTRHNTMVKLLLFMKEQGHSLQDSIEMTNTVLLNTYDNPETRNFIDNNTTREFVISETNRIASKYVFKNNYELSSRRKDVKVSKEEILEILNIKEWHLKKLLFSMLIHSKRYSGKQGNKEGEFYMAYSVLSNYGNTVERSKLKKHIEELENRKKILIISSNKLDKTRTRHERHPLNETNIYSVCLDSSEIESNEIVTLKSTDTLTLEQATAMLVDEQSAKKLVVEVSGYYQWNNHFKELYAV